jgi:hypothetical protein
VLVGSWSEARRQQPKKSSKFVLTHRVLLHGASQTSKFARASHCFNFEVFHHEYRSKPFRNAYKEMDSLRVKTPLGFILKKLYEGGGFFRSRPRGRPRTVARSCDVRLPTAWSSRERPSAIHSHVAFGSLKTRTVELHRAG